MDFPVKYLPLSPNGWNRPEPKYFLWLMKFPPLLSNGHQSGEFLIFE